MALRRASTKRERPPTFGACAPPHQTSPANGSALALSDYEWGLGRHDANPVRHSQPPSRVENC